MKNLKDHEYFLYRERLTHSRGKRKFAWEYAITSKDIKNNENNFLGRITGDLEEVLEHVDPNRVGTGVVKLKSNVFYRGDFATDGGHGEQYIYQEKGVSEKVMDKSIEILKERGVSAKKDIFNLSLRHFV